MAVSKNDAKYATAGTALKFWAVWREKQKVDAELKRFINQPLSPSQKDKLFSNRFKYVRAYFDRLESEGREITGQDRALYALCRPDRLLELMFRFILFDEGEKKIARYQQFFCVNKILDRIKDQDREGKRKGGVVWHTQGSGKSLTMVMLAKAIALAQPPIENNRIVLVTDRIDLDDQIYRTFLACREELVQANTGAHLIELLKDAQDRIIATTIFKFDKALNRSEKPITNPNIFVLVDESHRTNYGETHAKMKRVLPNACYIGFTGTPLLKKDKNTMQKFGGMIDTYTISEAVEDKAVVPLLYEGRYVPQDVNEKMVDSWFELITENLTQAQKADLKRKFAKADPLNRAEQKVMIEALDISSHFANNWKGTRFKAQLVADRKITALKFKKYLDDYGKVRSEVLISGPDEREGEDDIYTENKEPVNRFWKTMMDKFGTEKQYNKQVINAFKYGDELEVIIVVDKLLTGFDAPRNTVLYLTRKLEDHNLLQAIARVNRLEEGKEYGYIVDYYGVLSELGSALDLYGKLAGFDKDDLQDLATAVTDINEHIKSLPQKHSDLWDIFKGIKNKLDEEEFERLLADEEKRDKFKESLSVYARTLGIAVASEKFLADTPAKKMQKYTEDLRFFMNLRSVVTKRYSEEVNFGEYEEKIQKLIDTHVGSDRVEKITALVNIFDKENFAKEVAKVEGKAAKADTIASRTGSTLEEKWKSEDPAFYEKFSKMLKEVIEAFRNKRISEAEYLKRVQEIMESVQNRTGDDIPDLLSNHDVAKAFFGIINLTLEETGGEEKAGRDFEAQAALGIDEIVLGRKIVNWEYNTDIQNQMRNQIEDYLIGLQGQTGIKLSFEDMDKIMEECLGVARVRYHS